ncbi:pentatricopeptide repeat-containing protein At1g18900-like isoform X2 [Impatiens glandulifera]|nr:pentatricopeptide repeat-containing protein At1g18900-like isoform X2 [Impatiens glandulifera]
MLRTKQLGSLSQTARSFFLNGSWCNPTDGNSCTCPGDEKCVTSKQSTKNAIRHAQVPPTLVSKSLPAVIGSSKSENVVKVVTPHKSTIDPRFSVNRLVPANVEHSSPTTDKLVTAGVTAAIFLSDLVNYKIPTFEGNGMLSSTQNSMVEHSRPTPTVTSYTKNNPRERVHEKQPIEMATSSKAAAADKPHGTTKGRAKPNCISNNKISESQYREKPKGQCSEQASEGKFRGGEVVRKVLKVNNGVCSVASRTIPNSNIYLVDRVSNILRQLKWGPRTEDALRKLNCSFDAYQANQILKQVLDFSVALEFFNWLRCQPGFKHDGHSYTTMIGILGRAKEFAAINRLLGHMAMDGCQPNVVTFNRIIHSYGRANYLKEAVDVYEQMQREGCVPDRVTYCTLIDVHAKSGYLDFAMHIYGKMQEAGISADTFTYSVIINCLGKAGHLDIADKLFSEMVSQGCDPNIVTYNIMIALNAKARKYPRALQIYRKMQKAGFEPDNITYSIVMEVLGHYGYLKEAEEVFLEMKRKKWSPDEPVYGLLVDLWGKDGNVEKACSWYQAMLNEGLRPNVPTCNSLLSAFLRVHRLSDAYDLLHNMLNMGLTPSLQTYTLLLSCCTEAQSSYDMGFCCQLMGITAHPAHSFLVTMPEAAGPDGKNVRDHVSRFLDMMHSEDREGKRGLVDAVVDFLHKSDLKEEAGLVWEVAAMKNIYPDAVREKGSCYWLINLHVMSDGTAVTALSRTLAGFRQRMLRSGVCPSRIDIVTGWGRRSRVTGASLVRNSVQQLLDLFQFPFFMENGNSGCFVGCGEPLSRWLLQSYVERMHLL